MTLNLGDNPGVESLPAADITAPPITEPDIYTATSTRNLAVKIPMQDANDFIVEVSANNLRRIRERLIPFSKAKYSWSEILIGMGGATLGATLGAISAQVPLQSSAQSILFYIVCPLITVGTFVRYLSESRSNQLTASNLAREVLAEIPNPDEAVEKELSS